MFREERFEVVDLDRLRINVGIRTAGTDTGSQDIPDRNSGVPDSFHALLVRIEMIEPQQVCQDRPEGISRVTVILSRGQRCLAGHAAEDQHAGIAAGDRRKPVNSFRPAHLSL